jgi:hypothetical protein
MATQTTEAQENSEMTKNPKELSLEDARAHLQKCIDAGESPSFDLFRRSGIAHLFSNGASRQEILRGITDQVTPPIPGKVANGILTSIVRYCAKDKPQEDPVAETTQAKAEPELVLPAPVEVATEAVTPAPVVEQVEVVEADETIEPETGMVALPADQHAEAYQSHLSDMNKLIDAQLQDLASAGLMINMAKEATLRLAETLKVDGQLLDEILAHFNKPDLIRKDDSRVVLLTAFSKSEFTDSRIREALSSLLSDVVAD